MATLFVSEYSELNYGPNGQPVPVASEPAVARQAVTYTTSAQSSAFNGKTRFVRLVASADAYLDFGANPTAVATEMFLPSGTVEYFGVEPGQKVAAYDGSS